MGFKPRPGKLLPICVWWDNWRGGHYSGSYDSGWCLCKGPPTAEFFSQKTRCGMTVNLPGRYEHREPTCPECIKLLRSGQVDPGDYPQDLREFLPHE